MGPHHGPDSRGIPAGPGQFLSAPSPHLDVLRDEGAGGRTARGGAIRGIGYGVGAVLSGVAAIILLRYLGPVEFGQYSAVMAMVGIMAGVTEGGLNSVGTRDMALRADGPDRDRVLANLIGARLVVTPIGVLLTVLIAWAIGFDGRLVLGTLIGGIGVIFLSAQATMMLPLSVDIRMVRLTGMEVLRQAIALGAIAALAAAGASLLPFFAVQIAVGILLLLVTPFVVAGIRAMRPALDRVVWVPLIRGALPVAVAVTLNVVYFRVLMVQMEVLSTGEQTGYFATAFRLMEFLIALPLLVMSVALPVLAVASAEDPARMRSAVRTLCEVAIVGGIALALVVGLAAGPIVAVLGGPGYEPAVTAVQIQSLALIPLFVGQALQAAIIASHRHRLLIIGNGAALAVVLLGGVIVIPSFAAVGASWVAVAGEALLVAVLLGGVWFVDRGWLPGGIATLKLFLCGLAAMAVGVFVPLGGDLVAALVALAVFIAASLAVRAIPPDVLASMRPGGGTHVGS
jgi:O-antigen/teichoic acid export membrane protein